jgi:general secretion pathway protein G
MVLAIIGILAAIAIPNLLTALAKAKQKRTLLDIKTIAIAWEARAVDINRYNAAGSIEGVSVPLSIDTLASALEPTYSKSIPKRDGWGQPFTCLIDQAWGTTAPAARYVIISGGADQQISSGISEGPFSNFACDIIYTNGVFLTYPEGTQVATPPSP